MNPAYTSTIAMSDMERELKRLYDATDDGGVLPSRAAKYFTVNGERKDLTAQEYVKYATLSGQGAYRAMNEIVSSKDYAAMGDEEKAAVVKDAYSLANAAAKTAISDYMPDAAWMRNAIEAEKKYHISQGTFLLLRRRTADIGALKKPDGDAIKDSKGLLIMQEVYSVPGLSDEQRQALFEYFGVGKNVIHLNKAAVEEKLTKLKKQAGK